MIDVSAQPTSGSHDGLGAGDHDLPYRFGRRPRANAPYPFSTRQYARLLVLRSWVRETLGAEDLADVAAHVPSHGTRGSLPSAA